MSKNFMLSNEIKDKINFDYIYLGSGKITIYKEGDKFYFAVKTLCYLKNIGENGFYPSVTYQEMVGIDSCNRFKRKKIAPNDKFFKDFLTIDGVFQWLHYRRNLNKRNVELFLVGLKEKGIQIKERPLLEGVKERTFGIHLENFCRELGVDIKKQVLCGSYIIDFVVGGKIAVEFDEVGHCGYDKEKERIREAKIKENYLLLRADERTSIGEILGKIAKLLKEEK